MIWLANGASALYQWERGVTVNCDKPCDVLSIWREDDKKSVRIVPTAVQGVYRTEIPRQLLQQSGYLRFEAIDAADDGERIIDTARIIIRPRKKPDDYPANGQESEYWQSLQLRMDALERKAREGDFKGERGDDGITPHVGANGNWFLGEVDTGVHASGVEGAPYIGENGNWWFNGVDSGVQARGERGEPGDSPYIGANGNWFVEGEDTDVLATNQAVGDILETFRTDLGDDWLLCNGTAIPEGEYPALREMMPYNTEWVDCPPLNEYEYVSPIPYTHKWVRVKRKVDSSTYAWDKAEVFDAETLTSVTVECPLVVTDKTCFLYGITHDGSKYVLAALCYGEVTSGRHTMHLYKSDDLTAWEQIYVYTFTDTIYPGDFTFDGVEYLLAEGYASSDGSSTSNYSRYAWATPVNLSGTTKLNTGAGGYTTPRFRPCPPGYFSVIDNGGDVEICRAGNSGSVMSDSSSYKPTSLAFFNDRYAISVTGSYSTTIDHFTVFDLETETKTTITIKELLGLSDSTVRVNGMGARYDKNRNEWKLWFYYSPTYYEVTISADADPTVISNYTKSVLSSTPGTEYLGQMSLDRAYLLNEKLYNPSLKYLPVTDGQYYKYVYAGSEFRAKDVELEYIESTGVQCIDTGIIGKSGLEIYLDVEFTEIGTTSQIPIGSMKSSSDRIYPLSTGNYVGYGAYVTMQITFEANTPYTVYCKLYAGEQTVVVNSETVYNGVDANTYDAECTMLLFAASKDGTADYRCKAKIKSCKIVESGTLVRDYVPCRTWDGKVCMYDRVSGEYSYNVGAGTFIAGPEVGELEETV